MTRTADLVPGARPGFALRIHRVRASGSGALETGTLHGEAQSDLVEAGSGWRVDLRLAGRVLNVEGEPFVAARRDRRGGVGTGAQSLIGAQSLTGTPSMASNADLCRRRPHPHRLHASEPRPQGMAVALGLPAGKAITMSHWPQAGRWRANATNVPVKFNGGWRC